MNGVFGAGGTEFGGAQPQPESRSQSRVLPPRDLNARIAGKPEAAG